MQAPRSIVEAPDREGAVHAAIDEALARAVIYRAIAQGLRLPAAEGERSVFHPAGRAALAEAAAFVDARRPEGESLVPAVATLRARSGEATDPQTAHSRLFGHSRGLVCPFETEYGPDGAFRQPQELADIAGYYLAFGLRPTAGADERVDHAACECEFMEFLARKEAFALGSWPAAADEPESAEWLDTIQGAARRFLREHLGRFGRAFASLLMKEDAEGFHGALGAVLFRFLGKECQRFGLPAGPPTLELQPPLADDTPMACGRPEAELIQIQRRPRP
jgi:TorA maturation chaperone TorD